MAFGEMQDGFQDLTTEIDTIIRSPYPTSLKRLEDILHNKCTKCDLVRWAVSWPCKIAPLVECVLHSLKSWPSTFAICTDLCPCEIVEIRNAFLEQRPSLVHEMIDLGIRNKAVNSRYGLLTTALLSQPLPNNVALPANFQEWVVHLFDLAAVSPTMAIMKTIYKILKGTSISLANMLSPKILKKMECHLLSIVRGVNRDHQWPGLYCLSIINILSKIDCNGFYSSDSSFDTQQLLTSAEDNPSWSPETMQQYFSGPKAQKTVQLLVLRAVWACTTSTGEPHAEKTDTLKVALEILTAIPNHSLATWIEANSVTLRKLEEKVCAPQIDAGIRFMALRFMIKLYEHTDLPLEIQNQLRAALKELIDTSNLCADTSRAELERILAGSVVDKDTISGIFGQAMRSILNGSRVVYPSSESVLKLSQALSSAQLLNGAIDEGALTAFELLVRDGRLHSLNQACENRSWTTAKNLVRQALCDCGLPPLWTEIVHTLSTIFLRAMLSVPNAQNRSSQEATNCLLQIFSNSAVKPTPCAHSSIKLLYKTDALDPLSACESPCTERKSNWRQSLRACLQSRTEKEYERITDIFSEACAELERRCEEAELPGQEELHKYNALQNCFSKMQERCEELEVQLTKQKVIVSTLEAEAKQALDETDENKKQNTELSERVVELEQEIVTARGEAQDVFVDARRKQEMLVLEHATACAKKEEELEDIQEQLRHRSSELECKKRDHSLLRAQIETQLSKMKIIEQENHGLTESLASINAEVRVLTMEKQASLKSTECAEQEWQKLQEELNAERERHNEEMSELQRRLEEDLEGAESLNERKKSELQQTHNAELATIREEMSLLQAASRQKEDAGLRQRQQLIAEVEAKDQLIEDLNSKCEQKSRQVAEASAMRSNLMAAMGIQQSKVVPLRPTRGANQHGSKTPANAQSQPPSLMQAQVDGASSFSNASSAESAQGPTPKRQRPRKSFKPISSRSPRMQASTHQVTKKRLPLSSISGNSPMKQMRTPKLLSNESVLRTDGQEQEQFQDDTTFDGSDVFVGTQAYRLFDLDAKGGGYGD